jgi:hypothetical protein
VRTSLAVLAALATALTATAAQAAPRPRLSMSPTGYKVVYGHQVTLSGRLSTGLAGQRIVILGRPFGDSAPHQMAIVTTHARGRFQYIVRPSIGTTYSAAYTNRGGTVHSPGVPVGVRPHLTAMELGDGRIMASVGIGKSMRGRFAKLQHRVGGGWQTLEQRQFDRLSNAVFPALTFAPGLLRVTLSVNAAGKGYLGSSTHGFTYRFFKLTIVPSSLSVDYGNSVTLGGRLVNGKPGQRIAISAQRYGTSTPIRVATVTTRAGGEWSFHVAPTMMTVYQASSSEGFRSERVPIGVKPVIMAHELPNGHVVAHVKSPKSLHGRRVQFQQLMDGGRWSTVSQQPLDRSMTAVFAPPLPSGHVRVALSVNQAGKGLLGSVSHTFVYQAI